MTPRDNFGQIWKLKKGDASDQSVQHPDNMPNQPYNLPIVVVFSPSVCKVGVYGYGSVVDKDVDKRWVDGVNMRVVIEMR